MAAVLIGPTTKTTTTCHDFIRQEVVWINAFLISTLNLSGRKRTIEIHVYVRAEGGEKKIEGNENRCSCFLYFT
jgi:hypothetical protein